MRATTTAMLLVWAVALAVAVSVLGGLWSYSHRNLLTHLDGIGTVVVGTALVRHLVPDPTGAQDMPPLGPEPFLRLGYNHGLERRMFDVVSAAAARHATRVYLEVNPVVSRFANQPEGCGPDGWIGATLTTLRQGLRATWTGNNILSAGMGRPYTGPVTDQEGILRDLYPLSVLGSCFPDRCTALFADHPDMRVVLIAMPRAPLARDSIGPATMAEFHAAARQFADATGAALFVADPDGTWPAGDFVDQAHLSRAGAARLLRALVAFVADLP